MQQRFDAAFRALGEGKQNSLLYGKLRKLIALKTSMPYTKTIVCFANSRKNFGRCIAGKEWSESEIGQWIRPVSNRIGHEISEPERCYQDGSHPQLLDIIKIPFKYHSPVLHQNENHMIDHDYYWVKQGSLSFDQIDNWLDQPSNLWEIGNKSYVGMNNRVHSEKIKCESGVSLYLIKVEYLHLRVGRKTTDYPDSKRAILGQFFYHGTLYRMDVTDPEIEFKYLNQPDGQYRLDNPVLCISLGDLYQGNFYKLIAAVFYKERFL